MAVIYHFLYSCKQFKADFNLKLNYAFHQLKLLPSL